jgi:hypothetical protein
VIHSLERDVFPTLGAVPVREITAPQVLKLLRSVESRPAIETARRIRQRIWNGDLVGRFSSPLIGATLGFTGGSHDRIFNLDCWRSVTEFHHLMPIST